MSSVRKAGRQREYSSAVCLDLPIRDRSVTHFNRIYDIIVELEFDPAKNARNVRERGISFERFADIDLGTAVAVEDTRADYGERRVRLLGTIDGRLDVAVITYRCEKVRVISLRRANEREERLYAEESKTPRR